ncbi:MAG: hypothetical protein NT080_14540 [Spirochaetes bacterium]|nr:hypothetical protein [Spirochaetota bacterium]
MAQGGSGKRLEYERFTANYAGPRIEQLRGKVEDMHTGTHTPETPEIRVLIDESVKNPGAVPGFLQLA